MKVLFFFPPAGTDGGFHSERVEPGALMPAMIEFYRQHGSNILDFSDTTIRIYLRGCQNPKIGNGLVYPDLDIAAQHILNSFEGKQLNLEKLKENLGDGIYAVCNADNQKLVDVDSIGLEGHSRGAMSIFAVAKKIDSLGIPIDLIANQPVPGDISLSGRLVKQYSDLSHCLNIRSAAVLLATHSNYNSLFHNMFFKQLLPKFSPHTIVTAFLIPFYNHYQWIEETIVSYHINRLFSEYGYTNFDETDVEQIRGYYLKAEKSFWWKSGFIPLHERQPIIEDTNAPLKDPIYLALQLERAKANLEKQSLLPDNALSEKQAAAVDYLYKTYGEETSKELISLVLENSLRGKRFAQIIQIITETCHYVATLNLVNHRSFTKADLIRDASKTYQQSVFNLLHDFLVKDQPTDEEKIDFKKSIYIAEVAFRKNALQLELGFGRQLLKFLTNFILHVTGVALIANSIHKAQTGNWLFFNHNRSTTIIRDTRQRILDPDDFSSENTPK